MDKVTLKITTGAYAQPYFCEGGRLEDDKQLVYEWIEDGEPNEGKSKYRLIYDKATKKAQIKRSGAVEGTLHFEAGCRTTGSLKTGYGTMDLHIETFYINVPNIFVRNLEISYKVDENPDLANNRFIISET